MLPLTVGASPRSHRACAAGSTTPGCSLRSIAAPSAGSAPVACMLLLDDRSGCLRSAIRVAPIAQRTDALAIVLQAVVPAAAINAGPDLAAAPVFAEVMSIGVRMSEPFALFELQAEGRT